MPLAAAVSLVWLVSYGVICKDAANDQDEHVEISIRIFRLFLTYK